MFATSTLAAIGTAISIASAGIGAVGAMQQADAQRQSAEFNAKVAENNAKVAQQKAISASQAGEQQAAIKEQETRSKVGAMLAAQGASGVDVNTGSAAKVRVGESQLGHMDAMTIRSNAAKTAYGYQTEETNFQNQASVDKATASNAPIAGAISAGGALLGGLGSASSSWANYKNKAGGMEA